MCVYVNMVAYNVALFGKAQKKDTAMFISFRIEYRPTISSNSKNSNSKNNKSRKSNKNNRQLATKPYIIQAT